MDSAKWDSRSCCSSTGDAFAELSSGRRLLTTGQYRPHIVIGPQSQRVAICEGNVCMEKYLGVMFVGGPDAMNPSETAEVSLALMYFPEETYSEVLPGATFSIREGPLIVGFGVILSLSKERQKA